MLPPGLGRFPLRRIEDYADKVPADWLEHGGVMLPIYQREALWLRFSAREPAALQVAAGTVCAVSGEPFDGPLSVDPQNYLAVPRQPWLDGFNTGAGVIRQFVAVPLGIGATVEAQVTGEDRFGGLQLRAFSLTEQAAEAERQRRPVHAFGGGFDGAVLAGMRPRAAAAAAPGMGLGAGGQMSQQITADTRPLSDYRDVPAGRVFVHLCSAAQWQEITGELPPPTPVSPQAYTAAGLPWFDYYDTDAADVAAAAALAGVKPTGTFLGADEAGWVAPKPHQVVPLGDAGTGLPVTDGTW